MALVGGRFQAADLLLRSAEFARQVFLGEAGLFAKFCDLQSDVPSLSRPLESLRKIWITKGPNDAIPANRPPGSNASTSRRPRDSSASGSPRKRAKAKCAHP